MLASLWNIPKGPESLSWFSFSNQQHHAAIAQATLQQLSVTLVQYPIDPLPALPYIGAWLYNHQTMHNQQNAVLGVVGNDLTTVDFSDPSQVTDWIELHAEEHRQAAIALGI